MPQLSKCLMPVPLYKVMFVELDRGEAQRHLDELKRALGSASNPNIQSNYSPYSGKNSVESFARPSLKNKEPL